MLGRTYDAEEAYRMGMVNAVVPHVQLEKVALEWAAAVNAKSPMSVRMLKYAFNLADDGLVGQQLFAGEATRLAYMTEEAAEGRDAFLGRRPPDWSQLPLVLLNAGAVRLRARRSGRGAAGRTLGDGAGGEIGMEHLVHHFSQAGGDHGALLAAIGEKARCHHGGDEGDGERGDHTQALLGAQRGLGEQLASAFFDLLVPSIVPRGYAPAAST